MASLLLIFVILIQAATLVGLVILFKKPSSNENEADFNTIKEQASSIKEQIMAMKDLIIAQKQSQQNLQQQINQNHNIIKDNLRDNNVQLTQQVQIALQQSTKHLQERFDTLNLATERHMLHMTESVEQRLSKGFEKTNETFTNIMKRLVIIDDAQKRISDLSQNVVTLQNILSDKKSRGAFGEVQLNTLIANALPEQAYRLQHSLASGARADCMLFLPKPTGNIVIDSKFPLENYQRFIDDSSTESEKTLAKQQFKQDIKKHIGDIASKYIVPGETSDGAIMFIPAESIFAEIHAHHGDLVALSHNQHVWMTSPSTLMAILTTASAVIKDSATREQVHIIQKHLQLLAKDFGRFEKRMDSLSKHIHQATEDADLIHTSAKKISSRFMQIEQVDLGGLENTFSKVALINPDLEDDDTETENDRNRST